jgi:hypothetical protein
MSMPTQTDHHDRLNEIPGIELLVVLLIGLALTAPAVLLLSEDLAAIAVVGITVACAAAAAHIITAPYRDN